MIRRLFVVISFMFYFLMSLNAGTLDWDQIYEDFDDPDLDLMMIEHTAADRTLDMENGFAVLKRSGNPGDLGPTLRAYFDDPGTSQFILYAKVDLKNIAEDGHFIICARINGFEYFPTIEIDRIGDHETPDQNGNGQRSQEVMLSPLGVHEYIIVGKSENAYDLYFDGQLVIEDGVTRSLGGAAWEVAQVMIHVRTGTDLEVHVDAIGLHEGNDGLNVVLAVSPKDKLPLAWGKLK